MLNHSKMINPQALINVFGDVLDLNGSELIEVRLTRDGAALFIRLQTSAKVKFKPERWSQFDVVYLEMSFWGIKELMINGFGTSNLINRFDIKENQSENILEIICSNQTNIRSSFDWVKVEKISPGLLGTP